MSPRRQRAPRFTLTFHPAIGGDIAALDMDDLDAAVANLDDLAAGRVSGKLLGERAVTGDLSGLARVKFDLPGRRPQRFRIVYREMAEVRDVLAFGLRDEHAIYRAAVRRLQGRAPDKRSEQ